MICEAALCIQQLREYKVLDRERERERASERERERERERETFCVSPSVSVFVVSICFGIMWLCGCVDVFISKVLRY